jgi:glycosyltransferase involved in cell wall biosynthesis
LSVFERKNPLGLLEVFRAAFGGASNCHLVMKVNHAEQRPAEMRRIREAAGGLPVTIIDRTLDRNHVTALMQTCDCLVSLHRSEGFGLALAEAMYLSKPVIATAYSGNLDFTRPDNAFLVDYDLARIPAGCEPYDEGLWWAQPNLEHAVSQLQSVVNAPEVRRARAARGRELIRSQFAPVTVGKLMAERLAVVRRLKSPREVAARQFACS